MESPRKFNDCYFYYYSTCTKGDNCVFRHEPSALGCETMCSAWQQGKCLDKRCKLRHMELRKNRKQIPCYWENQPGGCRKKHCPFMHKNPEARTDGIAPSQPAPLQPAGVGALSGVGGEGAAHEATLGGVAAPPPPAPLPLLWQHQQQRQVVLDSALLGVLPGAELVARRAHAHAHAHAHDAPVYSLPVDPLVVNFEEESDNESAPSSTPTKPPAEERGKAHELLLLEQIQAAAAAFYSYDATGAPPEPPRDRRLVRANLAAKYDRLSLDDIAGNKQPQPSVPAERRKSLDFQILSLDEIRARKKTEVVTQSPITLNLSRKRKLSTQETVTTSGNKIIKVVRSNSIVYKKVDPDASSNAAEAKNDRKQNDSTNRKRTLSEASEVYDIHEDELVDNCHEFKRIKLRQQTSKPRLIRNRPVSLDTEGSQASRTDDSNKLGDSNTADDSNTTEDLDVQIISVELAETTDIELYDSEIIDVESTKISVPVDIVDLSDDDDVTITGTELAKNVPDVVASCQKKVDNSDKDLLKDIDSILNDSLDEEL